MPAVASPTEVRADASAPAQRSRSVRAFASAFSALASALSAALTLGAAPAFGTWWTSCRQTGHGSPAASVPRSSCAISACVADISAARAEPTSDEAAASAASARPSASAAASAAAILVASAARASVSSACARSATACADAASATWRSWVCTRFANDRNCSRSPWSDATPASSASQAARASSASRRTLLGRGDPSAGVSRGRGRRLDVGFVRERAGDLGERGHAGDRRGGIPLRGIALLLQALDLGAGRLERVQPFARSIRRRSRLRRAARAPRRSVRAPCRGT